MSEALPHSVVVSEAGPPPGAGRKALYHDRDGRVYQAVLVREYERLIGRPTGASCTAHAIPCAELRVNFPRSDGRDNWITLFGISKREHLLGAFQKPWYEPIG